MPYGRRSPRKSALEGFYALVMIAILAGIVGGGLVGIATDHRGASSSTTSTGLSQ